MNITSKLRRLHISRQPIISTGSKAACKGFARLSTEA